MNKEILLAYYGDDFTGSTDALEFLCNAGVTTMLFIEPPTEQQLAAFPNLDAYGVAGKTRSLSPQQMQEVLEPAFVQMKNIGAKYIHYKVCSTFDSSPNIGSIGKAIDIASPIFKNKLVPVIGGTPALGRYCLFGNLFAKMGIGSDGNIFRLDRHPSMSKHPVTPADESDLRLHLQKQTHKPIALIDVLQLNQPVNTWNKHIQDDEQIVLLDTLYDEQLLCIGEWLAHQQNEHSPLFIVGGSSVEMAMGQYWKKNKIVNNACEWNHPAKAEPLLVVSGSCSPVTASQIAWAKANGFEEVVIDAIAVCNNNHIEENVYHQVNQLLLQQKNVIVHTGNKQAMNLAAEKLGTVLGLIAKNAVENAGIKRVVVAGGDTSSYAARAMQIDAVEMMAPLVKGAPLCKAFSANKNINGLEVNFKGGQVGGENYFGIMLKGEVF